MSRFDLKHLDSYDDESLLAELIRVAGIVQGERLTRGQFTQHSRVHDSTISNRFGSWRKALELAGLSSRFDDSTAARSREDIIEALKTLSKRLGRDSVRKSELLEYAGISDRPVRRLFGSYRSALEAAGLQQNARGLRYTDEECYENLLNVWTALGRQPTHSEMRSGVSLVGPKAYVTRWGTWRGALRAFVERANQDATPVEAEVTLESGVQESTTQRPARAASLGLRYSVLLRDRFRCVLCGRSPATHPRVSLHVDHHHPLAAGGETTIENLRTLCSDCNLGKGARIEAIDGGV